MKRVSTHILKKRIFFIFLVCIIFLIIMVIRLGYVQFVISEKLTEKATESLSRDISFHADRGKILDRNGDDLIKNISAPSVIIIPKQIDDKQTTAHHLANILNMSEEKAYEYVTKNESIVRIHPEGRKLSKDQQFEFQRLNLNGIYLAKDTKRYYPYDKMLAHVLGFTGIDNQGLMGIEAQYDEKLKGKNGRLSFFSDAKGRRIDHQAHLYEPPEDGYDLKTTIDLKVQSIIERELDIAEATYNPDGAIAIAVDPNTGGVLGMSSRPNFHPGEYQQYDSTIFDRNLPIWSTFEPGSTFKIITLAAALEENLIDLEKDEYYDKGSIKVGGANLRCWKAGGHGSQTYLEVVENSCNPGFVNLGMALGKERLFSYIERFGFGKKTNIDLFGEGSGILFDLDQVGPVELATTSFGQGVSVTPIQQVMAMAAAVNGGYLYEPYIAEQWIDPATDDVVESFKPKLKEQVISKKTSEQVRNTLESVVAKGTGRPAYVDGYRVGGKTGTAQKVGSDGRYMKNNYIVSFIGFAPADDPEIVVYVAIDHPKDVIQFGGVVAAPIVGTIIEDSLMAMDVPTRDKQLDKEYVWPEAPKVDVPNLVGKTIDQLMEDYSSFSIEVNGEGKYIIDQAPKAGVKIEEDATIRVYLSDEKKKSDE